MTTPANIIPVDYSSRDYPGLRSDLIDVVQSRIPEWRADDPADFGVALVEAVAYIGDILNYYVDRAAAETFIGTASTRSSILNLASLLGYAPSGRVAASVPLTFINTGTVPQTVPAGAQLVASTGTGDGSVQLTFEVDYNPESTDGSWTVPGGGKALTIPAHEGRTIRSAFLGQSSGTPGQTFTIRDTPLINRSVQLAIGPSPDQAVPYAYVQNLYEATPSDHAFTYRTDDAGVTVARLGDGVSGAVPPVYQNVYATYRLGGGTVGNISHGMVFVPRGFTFTGSITNTIQASGGAEEESTERIRAAAYTAFRTRNSAVTKQDFEDLALADNRISKAKSRGNSYTNMTVYVAPVSSGDLKTDPQPGFDAYNIISRSVTNNVAALTLSEAPQFSNATATLSGMGAPWDGTFSVASGGNNTVSFPLTASNTGVQPCTGVMVLGELPGFADVRADIARSIQSKGVVGTSVKVLPPRYRDVKLTVKVGILPQYRQTTALASVKSAVGWLFDYNQQPFNLTLRPQEVLAYLVNNVPELKYASVDLYSTVADTTPGTLVMGGSDEILRLLPNNLTMIVDPADTGIVNA